jgi:hypothetical protein
LGDFEAEALEQTGLIGHGQAMIGIMERPVDRMIF